MIMSEGSPGQGLPEVDVPAVALIAVATAVVIVVTHRRLALQVTQRHARLAY